MKLVALGLVLGCAAAYVWVLASERAGYRAMGALRNGAGYQ